MGRGDVVDRVLEDERVRALRDELEDWRTTGAAVSDLVDAEGHQYVDLVMEGGGVLGVALVGYTWALETAGIRFLGIGGTSAGAINALLLSALARPSEAGSERVLGALAEANLWSFVDGGEPAREFVKALGSGKTWKILLTGAFVAGKVARDLGLNPGDVLEAWLERALADVDARTVDDLSRRRVLPPLSLRAEDGARSPVDPADVRSRLALITAEVTTESKVELPRMARMLFADPGAQSPASFVRASMSIPGLFRPVRVAVPRDPDTERAWRELNRTYRGRIPDEVVLVDGGIVSNFPIDLFHVPDAVPRAPTFGVKLGTDREEAAEVDGVFSFLGAMFDTARHAADLSFLQDNPDYRHLVATILTGEHDWLNFEMTVREQADLFRRGAAAARDFLLGFDWGRYKDVRRSLLTCPVG